MDITYDIDEQTGCWNCTSHTPHVSDRGFIGYFHIKRDGIWYMMHRYMYMQKYGQITPNDVIRHTCDNPMCINPDHLLKGTHQDNVRDRVSRNRSAIGVQNGCAKLTEAQVLEIYNSTDTNKGLARKYHVSPKLIYDIKRKNIWKHLLSDIK